VRQDPSARRLTGMPLLPRDTAGTEGKLTPIA
jgi:hypothetical protein